MKKNFEKKKNILILLSILDNFCYNNVNIHNEKHGKIKKKNKLRINNTITTIKYVCRTTIKMMIIIIKSKIVITKNLVTKTMEE